jgi:hypothetical protein
MKVSPEIQSPSYFTAQRITLQEFPKEVRSFKLRENITTVEAMVFLGSGKHTR